jgi:branched-chain amino acid transport system substrate-binding protein
VNGRKIEFITLDDAYEPPKALQNARRLVQEEKVFAMFNTLGTPNNLAIWDFLNQQKVPQLYVATGASDWGKDIKAHPYTIGWQPNYVTEAKVYADYLKRTKPDAKVAVLYQNDGFGKDLLGGFEDGIAGSGIKVVKKESYNVTDPTVAAPVGRLARSGADTFLDITTPKFSAQAIATVAKSGWKPLHILNNVGADKNLVLKPVGLQNAKGIVSTAYFKDPQTAKWANDPAVREYKAALKRYSPKSDPEDAFNMYGWSVATTMAKALEHMKQPTRAALMDAVRNMDEEQGTLLPGEKVQTTPEDGYPLEAMQIIKFDGTNWQLQGNLIEAKAQ